MKTVACLGVLSQFDSYKINITRVLLSKAAAAAVCVGKVVVYMITN